VGVPKIASRDTAKHGSPYSRSTGIAFPTIPARSNVTSNTRNRGPGWTARAAPRCARSNPNEYRTPGRVATATSSGACYRADNYLPQAMNVHRMHNDDPGMFLETANEQLIDQATKRAIQQRIHQSIQQRSIATPTAYSHSLRSSVLESSRESWIR